MHTGYTTGGGDWSGYWMVLLEPYYEDEHIRFCPTAEKDFFDIEGNRTGIQFPFAAWILHEDISWAKKDYIGFDSSYGSNSYTTNTEVEIMWPGLANIPSKYNYRTCNVEGAFQVPVLVGACWFHGTPVHSDDPPPYDGQSIWTGANSMGRFCMNRHNGYVGGVFLDWSARKIGLKELWELKWHRNWYKGVKSDPDAPANYTPPAWSDWMKNFKDYSRYD